MNPDINDPAWISQRETQWKTLQTFLKNSIRRTELTHWRKVFFGEAEFEYRNKRKYGENDLNFGMGFRLYPIQTPERWSFLIKVQYSKWWPTEKVFLKNLAELIRSMSNMSGDLTLWGWDVETQVDLYHFLLGDRFVAGDYELCGKAMKYPVYASWFHGLWLDQINSWLKGSIAYPDVRGRHLVGYWVSCLAHLHPLLFEPRLLRDYAAMLPQMGLKSLMASCNHYDLEVMKIQCQQENGHELLDSGERQAFLAELKTVFDTAELPTPMKRLWQMAKEEKDFGPESHGEMPENEDPSRLWGQEEFRKRIGT